ncbi:MAG: DUF805 domain-containing protein, partial [Pseudomonadota bacterium]
VQITSIIGFLAAMGLSKLLFGTLALPFVPFMPNPDPLHQALYVALPLAFSAPLFIKRLHDRGRAPTLFILYLGLTVGLALFTTGGSTTVHPVTSADLHAFIAKNVIHAPVSILGLWLLFECCFLKGTEARNRYGPSPQDRRARAKMIRSAQFV